MEQLQLPPSPIPQPVFTDPQMEETVISFLLSSLTNLQEFMSQVNPELFESRRYKAIWESALNYYQRYQGLLDTKGLEVLLHEAKVPQDKKADYLVLLSTVQSKVVAKAQFLLAIDQLKQFKQKRKLFDLANYVAYELKNGTLPPDKIAEMVTTRVLDLGVSQKTEFRVTSMVDTLALRQAEYADREANPAKYLGIPFGIKKLDDLTAGIFPEEFALFYGAASSGKSRTLASIAYNMFSRGRNVMYVTIEMPGAQVGRMFDARHFLISSSGIRHGRLTEEDRKKYFKGNLKSSVGDFQVVDAPTGCSFTDLIPVIRRYKMEKKLDAVVIDYLNLMRSSSAKTDGNEALRIGNIGRELKALARLEKVAVLSATTAKVDIADLETDEVGMEHVGWSNLLTYQADLIVFLRKGDATASLTRMMEAMVVKYRDGSNQKITLGVDFDKVFVGDYDVLLKSTGAMSLDNALTSVPVVSQGTTPMTAPPPIKQG